MTDETLRPVPDIESELRQKQEKVPTWVAHITIILVMIGFLGSMFLLLGDIVPDGRGKRIYRVEISDSTRFILSDVADTIQAELINETNPVVEKRSFSNSQLTFNQNPKLLIWMLLFSSMVAAALGLLAPAIGEIRKVILVFKPRKRSYFFNGSIIVVLLLLTGFFGVGNKTEAMVTVVTIIEKFEILLSDTTVFAGLIRVTSFCGCTALFGMLVVTSSVRQLDASETTAMSQFKILNLALRFFLTAISVLILCAVVTTSLMQQAIEAVIGFKNYVLFPVDFVYSYGMIFTILLAIVYIPIHFHLQTKGNEIEEALEKAGQSPEKVKSLGKESSLKNLQVLFSILAPALGGIFSEILKHIG